MKPTIASAALRAATTAEVVRSIVGRLAAIPGPVVQAARASIFDGHNPLHVMALTEAITTSKDVTVADLLATGSCLIANALSLVVEAERDQTVAAVLCLVETMLEEAAAGAQTAPH